jgi:hypothetical protein
LPHKASKSGGIRRPFLAARHGGCRPGPNYPITFAFRKTWAYINERQSSSLSPDWPDGTFRPGPGLPPGRSIRATHGTALSFKGLSRSPPAPRPAPLRAREARGPPRTRVPPPASFRRLALSPVPAQPTQPRNFPVHPGDHPRSPAARHCPHCPDAPLPRPDRSGKDCRDTRASWFPYRPQLP